LNEVTKMADGFGYATIEKKVYKYRYSGKWKNNRLIKGIMEQYDISKINKNENNESYKII